MRKILLVLIAIIIQIPAFAYEECGKEELEASEYQLHWVQVGVYQVNSIYANVVGIICAGIDRNFKEVKYLNYRDNFGVKVFSGIEDLLRHDIPYLRRSDFPAAARWVTRSAHPLTVKVESVKSEGDTTNYSISLKFLRNVRKSFYITDIRDLRVQLSLSAAKKSYAVTYDNVRFDKISLSISTGLNISSVLLLNNDHRVKSINPFSLPQAKRTN